MSGLKVSDIGAAVRAHRKASGISQKDLAIMVGVSRATLNYLESGREIEIGAGRLFDVLDVLGIELSLEADTSDDKAEVSAVLKAQSGKGAKRVPLAVLVEALTTGRMQVGWESQLSRFVDEAPDRVILAAIRLASEGSKIPAKEVWKNGRALAKECSSARLVWRPKE